MYVHIAYSMLTWSYFIMTLYGSVLMEQCQMISTLKVRSWITWLANQGVTIGFCAWRLRAWERSYPSKACCPNAKFLVYMIVEKNLQRYDPLAIICDVQVHFQWASHDSQQNDRPSRQINNHSSRMYTSSQLEGQQYISLIPKSRYFKFLSESLQSAFEASSIFNQPYFFGMCSQTWVFINQESQLHTMCSNIQICISSIYCLLYTGKCQLMR